MNWWLACVIISFLRNAACDCGFRNPQEALVINLYPKDENYYLYDVYDVKRANIISGTEKYIDLELTEDRQQLRLCLKNMRKLHWNLESSSLDKHLSYDLQITCSNSTTITIQNMVINLTNGNIYAPEMVAVETWKEPDDVPIKRYKLPMPFPPHVDITIINKLTVRDLDMYNEGIRLEWNNTELEYEVNLVQGLREKYFDISMKANNWLNASRYDDTLYISDMPSNPKVKPKYLMVDIIIKKDFNF